MPGGCDVLTVAPALFGLFAAVGFGSADFFAKLCSNKIGYFRTAFSMQLTGGIILLALTFQDLVVLQIYMVETVLVLGLGIMNMVGTLGLYKGFEIGRVSIVSPIASSFPALSTVLAVLVLHESLSATSTLGILTTLAGVVLVSMKTEERGAVRLGADPSPRGGFGVEPRLAVGALYAFVPFVAYGFTFFALKLAVVNLGPFLPVLLFRWTSALILGFALLEIRPANTSGAASPTFRPLYLILLIAVLDTFGNVAYNSGIIFGEVSIVSTIQSIFAVVTILLSLAFLKDKITQRQLLGIGCVVAGVAVLGLSS